MAYHEKRRNIVLNIPHTSINGVFDPKYGGWPHNQYFINNCLNKWTDWYTDFLFAPLSEQKDVSTVVFPYSRFVCDAERLCWKIKRHRRALARIHRITMRPKRRAQSKYNNKEIFHDNPVHFYSPVYHCSFRRSLWTSCPCATTYTLSSFHFVIYFDRVLTRRKPPPSYA